MDSQDGGGPGSNGRLHLSGVQRVVFRLDIHKHRPDFVPVKGVGGGNKRERRGDNLSGQLQPLQGDLQRQRAIVEEAKVLRGKITAKFALVALHHWAIVGEPAVGPDFFQSGGKLFQWRKKRPGYINWFCEWRLHNSIDCCSGQLYSATQPIHTNLCIVDCSVARLTICWFSVSGALTH